MTKVYLPIVASRLRISIKFIYKLLHLNVFLFLWSLDPNACLYVKWTTLYCAYFNFPVANTKEN